MARNDVQTTLAQRTQVASGLKLRGTVDWARLFGISDRLARMREPSWCRWVDAALQAMQKLGEDLYLHLSGMNLAAGHQCHGILLFSIITSVLPTRLAVFTRTFLTRLTDLLSTDDDSNNVSVLAENGESVPAKTTWTLLLYLTAASEGCAGGETSFYLHDRLSAKEEVSVAPEYAQPLIDRRASPCNDFLAKHAP
jgi:hypothetical protein